MPVCIGSSAPAVLRGLEGRLKGVAEMSVPAHHPVAGEALRRGVEGTAHNAAEPGVSQVHRDLSCENCDKFAVDRMLPALERGDLLVIHDTGAHGHSMSPGTRRGPA